MLVVTPLPITVFLFYGGLIYNADFFGVPPKDEHVIDAAWCFAGAFGALAAGPIVVWFFRGTRPWLISASLALTLGSWAVIDTLAQL